MECHRCHRQLSEEQAYVYQGRVFCEDCLMDTGLSMRECDPWATYVDKRSRVQPGMKAAESLTEPERELYEFIRARGRVSRQEVIDGLGISETELKVQLVPLMHGDLVKEVGQQGELFLIPVD